MRPPSHVKETIATRAFEYALHENLVAQSLDQGKDYGTDYIVSVFNSSGKLIRGFNVQVKYLPVDAIYFKHELERDLMEYFVHATYFSRPTYVKHRISLPHIRRYINPDISGQPTLYVVANERHFFYFWANDLYKYYLRWAVKESQFKGTMSIYISEIHSSIRFGTPKIHGEILAHTREQFLFPRDEGFGEGYDSFALHGLDNVSRGWIDESIMPGTVDSLTNLGISIYLQNVIPKSNIIKNFNTEGYWSFLLEERQRKPWIFFLFARFIGLLEPTSEMLSWASHTVFSWDSPFDIPAACQILSKSQDKKELSNILLYLLSRLKYKGVWFSLWFRDYDELLGDKWSGAENRFYYEYGIGISTLLSKLITTHKNPLAQETLINLFIKHDPSTGLRNIFKYYLIRLCMRNAFIEDESYKRLLKVCEIKTKPRRSELIEAMEETDYKRYLEYEKDK